VHGIARTSRGFVPRKAIIRQNLFRSRSAPSSGIVTDITIWLTTRVVEFARRCWGVVMKLIVGLEFPVRRHSGPVFVGGTWSVQLAIGRRQGRRYADLSPRAARRLACTLLLQAEKVEMLENRMYTFPKKLGKTIDRAVDAVIRFHSLAETFQMKMRDRDFQKSSTRKRSAPHVKSN
jgi:hypothetical protein